VVTQFVTIAGRKPFAVGSLVFVESVKSELAGRAMHRQVEQKDGVYLLRERNEAYNGGFSGKSGPLRLKNTVFWNESPAATKTYHGPTQHDRTS
jgi:hypothetical protein